MDLGSMKLFKMAMTRMDWAAQRQKVLSQNVANADTPDYRPKDVKEINFKDVLRHTEVKSVPVTRTNVNHLKGTIPEQDHFRNLSERKTFEESPDGNQVVVEEQMQKVGDTRSQFNTAVTLMQAHMRMLSMAVKGNSG